MTPYWSVTPFPAFCFWLASEWCAFVQREIEASARYRRNAEMFRRMEAAAVIEARRLTTAERVAILGEVWL